MRGLTIVLGALCLVLGASAQTPPTTLPPALPPPPPPPAQTAENTSTNSAGRLVTAEPIQLPSAYEWELTFEWVASLDPTNTSHRSYPIRIQVPFEHDHGFVFVRARKVEVPK